MQVESCLSDKNETIVQHCVIHCFDGIGRVINCGILHNSDLCERSGKRTQSLHTRIPVKCESKRYGFFNAHL